ncbi:MAG: hypothetical protein LIO79_02290 [Rikenellaceae bacterium]|nr:hypothetical protein [Rikenellaceae bacterium]
MVFTIMASGQTLQKFTSSSDEAIVIKINDTDFDGDFSFLRETEDKKFDFQFHSDTLYVEVRSDLDTLSTIIPRMDKLDLEIIVGELEPYFLTISNYLELEKIEFAQAPKNSEHTIFYDTDRDSPYLKTLREKYDLEKKCADANTDFEKVLTISSWVHSLWKHNGWNEPKKSDALSILEEWSKGRNSVAWNTE